MHCTVVSSEVFTEVRGQQCRVLQGIDDLGRPVLLFCAMIAVLQLPDMPEPDLIPIADVRDCPDVPTTALDEVLRRQRQNGDVEVAN